MRDRRAGPGIEAVSVLTGGTAAYTVLACERRELMREWVGPLHEALQQPLGPGEQTDPPHSTHQPPHPLRDNPW
ncbi:hypothetical protein [Streptomyces achromogenes]|uniref:hypothetical protein n=1 Tax=Streptomyces achromogenes TaxID=67255 RepID=UPI0033CD6DBC